MDIKTIKEMVKKELDSAIEKWPKWVKYPHDVGVVLEEAGEILQSVQNYVYGNDAIDEVYKECIQTLAMLFRYASKGDNEVVYELVDTFCQDYDCYSYGYKDLIASTIVVVKDIHYDVDTTDSEEINFIISYFIQFIMDIETMTTERKYIEN